MKKLFLGAVLITLLVLTSSYCFVPDYYTYYDSSIGNQVWMSENLNVENFRNGDAIPNAKTKEDWINAGQNRKPAWCYYNNDPSNSSKYGKLYNWYAVNDLRGLAPEGWHIPSDYEWTILIDHLGGKFDAGKKMKSTSGWNENGNGTNESGFAGMPGGYRSSEGDFWHDGTKGYWWASSEGSASSALSRYLNNFNNEVWNPNSGKIKGFSVRCIRD